MENPKTETTSDSQLITTPHLTVDSSPQSPSSVSSTTSSREPRTRWLPERSPVHLTIGSSPESQSKSNINSKPPSSPVRSPADSPARSSVSSDHTTLTHGSSPKEEKAPASLPENPPRHLPEKIPAPESVVGRSVHVEPMAMTKMDPGGEYGRAEEGRGHGRGHGNIGDSSRRTRPSLSILRRVKREKMVKRVALGFRVFGCLFCLVSFSVMAADRDKGWALDSFYRYKEFRYSMSVNVIGFIYSAAQAFDLVYHMATGKSIVQHQFRYYFDFAIDQMITYLVISASSSATARIDDWQSNWGKDKFPNMATASVSMSFLAFVALACSSLISGYTLCTSKSM